MKEKTKILMDISQLPSEYKEGNLEDCIQKYNKDFDVEIIPYSSEMLGYGGKEVSTPTQIIESKSNQVTISLEDYDKLKENLKNKDKHILKLETIINSDEKYIILNTSSFFQNGVKNSFTLNYDNIKTPKDFREDADEIISKIKVVSDELKANINKKQWYQIWR